MPLKDSIASQFYKLKYFNKWSCCGRGTNITLGEWNGISGKTAGYYTTPASHHPISLQQYLIPVHPPRCCQFVFVPAVRQVPG